MYASNQEVKSFFNSKNSFDQLLVEEVNPKTITNRRTNLFLYFCLFFFTFLIIVFFGLSFYFSFIANRPDPLKHIEDAWLFSSVSYCENRQSIYDWTCFWCKKTAESVTVLDIIEESTYHSLVYVGYNSAYRLNFSSLIKRNHLLQRNIKD
jgi:hypothetical protein